VDGVEVRPADGSPGAPHGQARCDGRARLTEAQTAALAGLPRLVGDVQQHVVCELAARHDGSHVAFIVASDDGERSWWMLWLRQQCQIIALDVCSHETDDQNHDACLLPVQHPGPHSFDLAA
jgi:hypothetical protein